MEEFSWVLFPPLPVSFNWCRPLCRKLYLMSVVVPEIVPGVSRCAGNCTWGFYGWRHCAGNCAWGPPLRRKLCLGFAWGFNGKYDFTHCGLILDFAFLGGHAETDVTRAETEHSKPTLYIKLISTPKLPIAPKGRYR